MEMRLEEQAFKLLKFKALFAGLASEFSSFYKILIEENSFQLETMKTKIHIQPNCYDLKHV